MERYAYVYFKTPKGRKKIKIRMGMKKEREAIKTGYISASPLGTPFAVANTATRKESEGAVVVGLSVDKESYRFDESIKEVEMLRKDAIEVPDIKTETPAELNIGLDDIKVIDIKYPLIPPEPKQGERVFAYAHIYFEKASNELVYNVVEPPVSDRDKKLLEDIKDFVQEKLEINFAQIRKAESVKYIEDIFEKAKSYFSVKGDAEVLKYYTIRDFIGLEVLEPLLQDKNIEDISCDGVNIPIYVYHRDPRMGSLRTNVEFSKRSDLDSFANKLSERCGKSISVARPLLDGTLPDGSRVQATLGGDIARQGSNFTIRMFTEKPLTPVDMIVYATTDIKLLAYMWFLVEHGASILISGGTASGKTSMLNVLSLFIKPQMKIVSIEDSVTGDCSVVISRDGKVEKNTIGRLVDGQIEKYGSDALFDREMCSVNPENIKVFSLDRRGKIILSPVSSFIRHATKKDIYRVKTSSGREIKVTGDHSLFTLDKDGHISTIKTTDLKPGSRIAVARILPYNGNNLSVNLLEHLDKLRSLYLKGEEITSIPDSYFDFVKDRQRVRWWKKYNILPVYAAIKIMEKGFKFDVRNLKIKSRCGAALPCLLEMDKNLLQLFGLWLAEGCYDKNSVIIANKDEECREVVKRVGRKFGIRPKSHSDGVSLMLNSKALKLVMENVLEFSGNAFTKHVPSWTFDLTEDIVSNLLSGYFSGDGHVSRFEVQARSSSIQLLRDLQTLLLRYGIISRISKFYAKDKTYGLRISSSKFLYIFNKKINFLQDKKCLRLNEISQRKANHDVTDIIPLSTEFLRALDREIGGFDTKSYYYGSYIGREALSKVLLKLDKADAVSLLADSDVFWDGVKSIEKVQNLSDYVYDISVPETENFICENIVAHNTAELRLPHPHWVPEVARTVINEEGKVDMFELLRESLRQRPDYIIVGEVRGKEAYVLFQQLAVGHAGMATIHADSFLKLMDRLTTQPISLPPNLIQNLDVILFIKRVKRGKKYSRRVSAITEILGYDRSRDRPVFENIFKWNPIPDQYTTVGKSAILRKIANSTGMSESDVQKELLNRAKVLQWMVRRNIRDYRKVSSIINLYYLSPDLLMKKIEGGL